MICAKVKSHRMQDIAFWGYFRFLSVESFACDLSIQVRGTRPLRKHLAKIYTQPCKLTCPHVFFKLY